MIGLLQSYHVSEILFAVAGILILIDYFFPTDWPAHLGYVCVGAALFFTIYGTGPAFAWDLPKSLALGAGATIVLELLHQTVFGRYLKNAPDESPDEHDQEQPAAG